MERCVRINGMDSTLIAKSFWISCKGIGNHAFWLHIKDKRHLLALASL
jgi:hypothetical protein